jgi:glycosyltransferase involved in cell wall biosynthesis
MPGHGQDSRPADSPKDRGKREPRRLLLVSPLPPRAGGIGVQSNLWLRCMRDDGWDVRAIRSNAAERSLASLPKVPRRLLLALTWMLYVLRVAVALTRTDVVFLVTSSWRTFHLKARPILRMAAWLRRPVILVFKGGDAANFLAAEGDVVLPAVRTATHVVVQTGFLQKVFAAHGIDATVVPNLIDATRFRFRERAMMPLRGLVTRSLEPIYNNACAIRAWAILARSVRYAELWIAGEGPEEEYLRKLAQEVCPGRVRFLGQVRHEDIASIYDQCTVLVNPSLIDNMPGSVLEAQTAGLPVVSTNVGGVPLVVHDGQTGLLIPPDDPEAMARAVERLLAEPGLAHHLVRHARESVRKFEWAEVRVAWNRLIASSGAQDCGGRLARREGTG